MSVWLSLSSRTKPRAISPDHLRNVRQLNSLARLRTPCGHFWVKKNSFSKNYKTAPTFFLERIFWQDFFKTTSTHRELSIPRVFACLGGAWGYLRGIYALRSTRFWAVLRNFRKTVPNLVNVPRISMCMYPSHTPRHHPDTQKHAESTVLDAYLWF